MKKVKLKWKVAEAPTGRYRSFQMRSWPRASYENGDAALRIDCPDTNYIPRNVKIGNHPPLEIWAAEWHSKDDRGDKASFTWRRLKKRFKTLDEAKQGGEDFLYLHPEFLPKSQPSSPLS